IASAAREAEVFLFSSSATRLGGGRKERPMRASTRAFAVLIGLGVWVSFSRATWIPPAGFVRTPETFTGDAFAVAPDGKVAIGVANFAGGASINVFASAAAAQANSSPVRTFTQPSYKAWGDLTFVDNNTLLFSENADNDTVYSGSVSSGVTSALAPPGSIPNAAGVAVRAGSVYVVAANAPGSGAVYQVSGNVATAVVSNLGSGYLGGIAFDAAGTALLTDSNDPTFAGNAGKIRRFSNAWSPLPAIDLAGGNGGGAYDVVLDSEGDAFVTTGATL